MDILHEAKLRLSAAAAVSAGTLVEGAVIDVADGCDEITFFATIATKNAGNYLQVLGGDANPPTVALTGATAIPLVNGDIAAVTIKQPRYRYLKPTIVRAGTNTATGDLYSLVRRPRLQPGDATLNNVASEIVSTVCISPATV